MADLSLDLNVRSILNIYNNHGHYYLNEQCERQQHEAVCGLHKKAVVVFT